MTSKLYFILMQLWKLRFICFVWEILFIWTMWQMLFFVAVKRCCIYLGSHPYNEDYQVSRISQKGCRRPLPSSLAKFSNIEDFQSRIIEWTSWENSQATKHCLDFCMTWRKKTVALKHLLAFWRRPHVRDCFNSVCWNVFHSKESSLKTRSL